MHKNDYLYCDADAIPRFKVTRYATGGPKDTFRQFRPDGNGGWCPGRGGAPRLLYRLPELRAAGVEAPVFVAEGEKDVATLHKLGLVATTNPEGAGKWRDEFADELLGRHVVVLPDNDKPGRDHALRILHSLHGKAASVKLVELPGIEALGKGADVTDWLSAGHTREELLELIADAATWALPNGDHQGKSQGPQSQEACGLPEIHAGDLDLPRVTQAAWAALRDSNHPPKFFRQGGLPVRIEADDEGLPMVREINPDRMRHLLARVATWYTDGRENRKPALPPMHVVRDVLATPNPPLPILYRIVEVPVFAPNCSMQTRRGYHVAGRIYYSPAKGLRIPRVSKNPIDDELALARRLILEEMLGDFPFTGDADRAGAVSLLLLPFVRDLIKGPTPLHLIEAPAPGTGKSLLATVLTYVSTGHHVAMMTEGRDEDEWRKRITARLRSGPTVVLIDNVVKRLESAALQGAITARFWGDRLLGFSEDVRLPVRCGWAATGNNPALSSEMVRRTVRIRLDAKTDRPWTRNATFRHPELVSWVEENRGDLIWACLTLVRVWIAAGCPRASRSLDGFEEWSRIMGGILEHAQIPGFLENLVQLYDDSDLEGQAWRRFVQAWWGEHQERDVTVAQLHPLALADAVLLDLGDRGDHSQKIRLGKLLHTNRDRQFDEFRIVEVGERQRAKLWQLHRVGQGAEAPARECGE